MAVSARPGSKRARQRAILEIVARQPIASQEELVEALAARGFAVTQATVSRDIAELRLVKLVRDAGHRYVSPDDLANGHDQDIGRLARLLDETPVTVGRSGLILVLRGPPGSAQALARAIDQSGLREPEGTLAGDDTVLVLFADEGRLTTWHRRFQALQGLSGQP